ncbi:STM4015 family protein [Micromonospora sp. NBC_01655]|uniref:STM4015 family protein n=1 Tax=Micromonospora sp. NBC_01655 TaxID=2975983 RepID=UPI002259F4E4|nr:STM4015 family protein [Micromonospora sp. NBC_01655]MCX4472198.1 STM4015 family protein [Micromonospora sp. NBC_01655]
MTESDTDFFAGRTIVEVPADGPLPDTDGPTAWRIATHDWDNRTDHKLSPDFRDALERFVDRAGESVEALVIGSWGYAAFNVAPIAQLCAAAPRLPNLKALFLGDIGSEECEISWMQVGDVSPLLTAYPGLEVLRVRGGEDFRFSPVRHQRLRRLEVESGGLRPAFVRAVLDSELPALEELELWLGTPDYGGDTTVADLAPLLAGERFPALRRLGLCNSAIADDLAEALAAAPVVRRLETLDLSLGTLGDRGALALAGGQPLTHLAKLDLSHHYVSEDTVAAVEAALPGVVDLSDPQEEEEDEDETYRYTAVSE